MTLVNDRMIIQWCHGKCELLTLQAIGERRHLDRVVVRVYQLGVEC
jgi:hypothetical protein